jgi:Outer membrane protein beta-barrel domain
MKKVFAATFIGCVFSVSVFAQSHHPLTFGAFGGLNFSNVKIDTAPFKAATDDGYQLGFYMRKGGFLYGQTGLTFQVFKSHLTGGDSTSSTVELHSLQLPLYVGINLLEPVKGVLNIRAYAGPVMRYDFNVPLNDLHVTVDSIKQLRFDGTIGVGVDVLFLSIDGGYSFGLQNLLKGNFYAKGNYGFVSLGIKL